jgi:hypothetical protein
MNDNIPAWVSAVRAADAETERLKTVALPEIADRRARTIAAAVASYGKGGRQVVADILGCKVLQVDEAIRRARGVQQTYAEALAEIPPLPDASWQVLRWVVRSTVVDDVWLEQPGELLAQEVEDIDPDELPAGVEQAALAQSCRSWNRIQALAVLDDLRRQ